jgi:hypothetical protein
MSDIKSLADRLRSKMNKPAVESLTGSKGKKDKTANAKEVNPKSNAPPQIPAILEEIRAYNYTDHKSMVHVRFDAKTLQVMNQFKMATGVDVTRLVAYSVSRLFKQHPELKSIIKQFLQKLDE